LLYPRDPAASAKNTVNCGCLTVPYRAAWVQTEPIVLPSPQPATWHAWVDDPVPLDDEGLAARLRLARAPASPTRAMATLEQFERVLIRDQQRRGLERVGIIAPSGDMILLREGSASVVEFARAELAMLRDATITHNHPKGTSLSPEDVRLAIRGGAKEIRAVGHAYGYRIAPRGAWPSEADVGGWMATAETEVRQRFQAAIQAAAQDPGRRVGAVDAMIARANFHHWHEVWSRVALASRGALEYERFVIDAARLAATPPSPLVGRIREEVAA
jgi:hypothetical protein